MDNVSKEKKAKRMKIYYQKNKEKLRAYAKIYNKKNKDKHSKRAKKYRQKNKLKIRKYRMRFYQENKEKILARQKKRWKETKAQRKYTAKEHGLTLEEYESVVSKCFVCGFDKVVDLHHLNGKKDKEKIIGLCPNHHHMIHRLGFSLKRVIKEEGIKND